MARNPDSWSMPKDEVIAKALEIVDHYERLGLTLTLRQLYYQFVSRGWAPSSGAVYDRIGYILTQARYDGDFPIEGIEDRGRSVRPGDYTDLTTDLDEAMNQLEEWIKVLPWSAVKSAQWIGQRHHVSVFIEKDALAGVIEGPCRELEVCWLPCKGYPSVSALDSWLTSAIEARNTADERHGEVDGIAPIEEHVILYLGDHDPDGIEIPRSIERNINKLLDVLCEFDFNFSIKRIALNMDQIRRYNPPPFEAKIGSRQARYIEEFRTDQAWELDALDPTVMQQLVRDEVNRYFDHDIYRAMKRARADRLAEVRERMQDPKWMRRAVGGE